MTNQCVQTMVMQSILIRLLAAMGLCPAPKTHSIGQRNDLQMWSPSRDFSLPTTCQNEHSICIVSAWCKGVSLLCECQGYWAILSLIVHIGINPRLVRSAEGQVLEGTTWKNLKELTLVALCRRYVALKLCSSPWPSFTVQDTSNQIFRFQRHLGWMCSRWQGDQVERHPSSKHRSHSCHSHVNICQLFWTILNCMESYGDAQNLH